MWDRVEAEARKSGLTLDLEKQAMAYPTERAHVLIRYAHAHGTQHALAKALFHAYFNEARDISDPQVLVPIAAAHGFDAGEAARIVTDSTELQDVRRAVAEAIRLGVGGVPLFVFEDEVVVEGAQPEEVLLQALEQAHHDSGGRN
jgi:predicted DsbA family dithiol-disulfide isomerase